VEVAEEKKDEQGIFRPARCNSLLAGLCAVPTQRHAGDNWPKCAIAAAVIDFAKVFSSNYCQWPAWRRLGSEVPWGAVIPEVLLAVYHSDTGWSEDAVRSSDCYTVFGWYLGGV